MAQYALVRPVGMDGTPFAIVADDNGADYVWPDGVDGRVIGLDAQRIQDNLNGYQPQGVAEWFAAAANNLGIVQIDRAVDAADMETARSEAARVVATAAEAAEAARSADPDSDEEEALERRFEEMGPVNPAEPHEWLPINVSAIECAFCEAPEGAQIHR